MFKSKIMSPQRIIRDRLDEALRVLLEKKHLYQSEQVNVGPDDLKVVNAGASYDKGAFLETLIAFNRNSWIPNDPLNPISDKVAFSLGKNVIFRPPDIKTFCINCGRIEAFNLLSCEDLLSRGRAPNEPIEVAVGTVQIFAFSYLCQSCKSVPEVFLIRRAGARLILSGRTPMEHATVPKSIPKSVSKFYSGAIIAHQSGQTLAANFLLRTLIEQFALSKSKDPKNADEAIDQYMASLPADFNQRFPSFREIYSTLSIDIHNAKGSAEVFDQSTAKIIKHFEARDVFDL